jgi:hypothetical protein
MEETYNMDPSTEINLHSDPCTGDFAKLVLLYRILLIGTEYRLPQLLLGMIPIPSTTLAECSGEWKAMIVQGRGP